MKNRTIAVSVPFVHAFVELNALFGESVSGEIGQRMV
jgi:hypothetical protein